MSRGCLRELHLYYGPLLAPPLCGFTYIPPVLPAIYANCQDVQDRMVSDGPIKQGSTAKSLIAHLGRWIVNIIYIQVRKHRTMLKVGTSTDIRRGDNMPSHAEDSLLYTGWVTSYDDTNRRQNEQGKCIMT